MADDRGYNEVGVTTEIGYQDGYDDATAWEYDVTVSHREDQSEVSLVVHYKFRRPAETVFDDPGVEEFPPGGRWRLEKVRGGKWLLEAEIIRMLRRACIPSEAKETTLRLICFNFLTYNWFNTTSVEFVSVKLETEIAYYVVVEEEEEEEEDEEIERVLEESMEEDYVREKPARREAVEELERFRVLGGERELRETSCVVCLEEFPLGIEVVKMPCSHVFHRDCIVRWLECRCFCPLCKFELPCVDDDEEEPMEENEEEDPMEDSDYFLQEAWEDDR